VVAGCQADRRIPQRYSRDLCHLILQCDHLSVPDHGQSRRYTLPRVPRGGCSFGAARLPLAAPEGSLELKERFVTIGRRRPLALDTTRTRVALTTFSTSSAGGVSDRPRAKQHSGLWKLARTFPFLSVAFVIFCALSVEFKLVQFTHGPQLKQFALLVEPPKAGPEMCWYGWIGTSALGALLVSAIALALSRQLTKRIWSGFVTCSNRRNPLHLSSPRLLSTMTVCPMLDPIPTRKPRAKAIFYIATVITVAFGTAQPGWSGGMPDEEADQQMPSKAVVGFVKDPGGNVVDDAKVVVSFKSGSTELITRSDATGHFRIPGFSKDADADSVNVSCSKTGYRQTATLKRRAVDSSSTTPIEVDCVLSPE
jgi:hypothetical protein